MSFNVDEVAADTNISHAGCKQYAGHPSFLSGRATSRMVAARAGELFMEVHSVGMGSPHHGNTKGRS
jgi:hypothetical protein